MLIRFTKATKIQQEKTVGLNDQLRRVSVDVAKGFQQLQKASSAPGKDKVDSAVAHRQRALSLLDAAAQHALKAEVAAFKKVGIEIDKGNAELSKAIDAYSNGDLAKAERYSEDAVACSDKACDLIEKARFTICCLATPGRG